MIKLVVLLVVLAVTANAISLTPLPRIIGEHIEDSRLQDMEDLRVKVIEDMAADEKRKRRQVEAEIFSRYMMEKERVRLGMPAEWPERTDWTE